MTSANVDQPLARLLLEQSRKLATLGSEPLAVASARNKFNDAYEDDYWCAVQLGPYRWEQSQFFGSSDPSGFGYAREHASTRLSRDGYASAEASASDVLAARAILKALDLAGWHELAEKEFRHRSIGGILALVIQFDQVWLHCSDPMGNGDDRVFAVSEDGFLELGFIDQRFDEIVGSPELICCYEPDPSALPSLSAAARAQFDDLIYDRKAAAQLAEKVIPIALTVVDVLHEEGIEFPQLALSLDVDCGQERYRQYKLLHRAFTAGPAFAVDRTYFDRNYFNIISGCSDRLPKAAERLQAIKAPYFRQLADYFSSAELSEIRPLFERATGVNTFDSSELLLLLIGAEPHLNYRTKVYPIERGGIGRARNLANPAGDATSEIDEWIRELPRVFWQVYDKFG